MYEGGVHVPLIVAGPDVAGPNRTNDTNVNAVDLFATILEMIGASVDATVPSNTTIDSRSLFPILQDANNARIPRLAYEERFGNTLAPDVAGQALRNEQFKLIRFADRHEELYDLLADPYEFTNLLTNAMSAASVSNHNGLAFALGRYQQLFTNTITEIDSGLSVTVQRNTNLVYELWRAQVLEDNAWSPVTNALVVTNGAASVTLTDTNAPTGSGSFYSVMGGPP
jgi:hypothetical protein